MRKMIWREFTIALRDIWGKKNMTGGLLRLNIRQYRGPEIELRDGTLVRPGDKIGEIHLANSTLFNILRKSSSSVQAVMKIKKEMKQELSQLAEIVQQKKVDQSVEAFFGITIFHQVARLLDYRNQRNQFPLLAHLLPDRPTSAHLFFQPLFNAT